MVENLKQYAGKKVVVVRKAADGSLEEIEGTAQTANDLAIVLKPKGKTVNELIEAGDIEEVRYVAEKLKELKSKSLKEVVHGDARGHLAERHGIALSILAKLTEENALANHSDLDHSDLGHNHDPKPAKDESAEDSAA